MDKGRNIEIEGIAYNLDEQIYVNLASSDVGVTASGEPKKNFYRAGFNITDLSEEKKLKYSVWAMLIGGIICTVVAINPPDFILATVMWAFGIAGASFGVPIVMGIWWKRANKYGCLAGMLVGFFTTFIPYVLIEVFKWEPTRVLYIFYGGLGWGKLFAIALPLVFIVVIVVSWLTEPPPLEVRKQVDMMHGWPDYDERRYNGKKLPIIIIILSVLCIALGFTLYNIFSVI